MGRLKHRALPIATMSEDWGLEIEDDVVATPIEVQDIKLFNKWSTDDVVVSDISLTDYISVKEKHAVYLPHTAGRYAVKRFRKAQCPIVERLTNSLMMHGRNNGKKLMTVRIIRHCFEISTYSLERTHFKFCAMQSSTVDQEKTPHVLEGLVLSDVKPLMLHHLGV